MSPQMIKEIQNMINAYIWKDSVKCKCDSFRILKEMGESLQVFDLANKDKTLKLQWVKTYDENHLIQANQSYIYKSDLIWRANIN